ncbi:MAG: polysaccharide pyruvyl transferase family protein [Chloroflexia bacterium]
MTPVRRQTRTRVVILGWYGSDNTGDEAVLQAIAAALRKRGVTDLHALSIDPAKTSARLSITSSPRSLFNPRTLRSLPGARALILGGGGLIQDRTSVYNLPIYALFVLAARLSGAQVMGWGLGVEPLDTLLGKLLARFICRSAAFFSVRDASSKKLLESAGVTPADIRVSADPALLLVPEPASDTRPETAQPKVIFCLRDLPDNRPGLNLHYLLPIGLRRKLGIGSATREDRRDRFVQVMARAVSTCTREFGAAVTFLPLWPGRDEAIMQAVANAAIDLGVSAERLDWARPEPGDVKTVAGAIGGADLLVSMRLHALIFAAVQGVPFIALAYARKVRGLARLLGTERWLVEVETTLPSAEEIEGKLWNLWRTRREQSVAVAVAASQARLRAEQDAETIARLLRGS